MTPSVPPSLAQKTSPPSHSLSPRYKLVFALFGAVLIVATALLSAKRTKEEPTMPTIDTALTKDSSQWRLIKSGTRVFASEQAIADFNRYQTANDEAQIIRIGWEGRSFSIDSTRRVEVLEETSPTGMTKIRYFSIGRDRTFDVWVGANALLPYDASLEKKANKEHETEERELASKLRKSSKSLQKGVTFADNTLAFPSDAALWVFLKAALNNERPSTQTTTEWVREGLISSLGRKDVAVVTSVDGPAGQWFKVEADGKEFWVADKSVSLARATSAQKASGSSAKGLIRLNEKFRLGGFSYEIHGFQTKSEIGSSEIQFTKANRGAVFVIVRFSIQNETKETKTVLADDFTLRDGKGRVFRAASNATTALLMENESKDFILKELQPGIQTDGVTAFEVPYDVVGGQMILVVPEKGAFGAKKLEILLNENP